VELKNEDYFSSPSLSKFLQIIKAATTFVKQVLDNGPHMQKFHR